LSARGYTRALANWETLLNRLIRVSPGGDKGDAPALES